MSEHYATIPDELFDCLISGKVFLADATLELAMVGYGIDFDLKTYTMSTELFSAFSSSTKENPRYTYRKGLHQQTHIRYKVDYHYEYDMDQMIDELEYAVSTENYELAAVLRDRIGGR
jgi:hypothetical protein